MYRGGVSLISNYLILLQCCLSPNVFEQTVYKFLTDVGIPIGSLAGPLIFEVLHHLLHHAAFWQRHGEWEDFFTCGWD